MAGPAAWLKNSFGDFAKLDYKSEPNCRLQPTNNQASTSDLPSCETNPSSSGGDGRGTKQSKEDEFGAKSVSTQVKSPVKTDQPTNEQDANKSSKIANLTCLKPNESTKNPVRGQVKRNAYFRFPTPKYWEKQKIRNLGSLSRNDRDVSVFAVVSYFHAPRQLQGAQIMFSFGLVDPTLYENREKLPCVCYQQCEVNMPLIKNTGDVIKLPLRIAVFQNKLQGKTYDDQCPWMTFDGQPNAPIVPRYSPGLRPTFTDADKKKVEKLKLWAASVGITRSISRSPTLAELAGHENSYFNLLCQVVHFDGDRMLYVWDGTQPAFPELLSNGSETYACATKWGDKVIGKSVKVWVYGSHAQFNYNAPGQYIQITDLHLISKMDTKGTQIRNAGPCSDASGSLAAAAINPM